MGTSQCSNGAPSNVSLVPPWVPDIQLPLQPPPDNAELGDDSDDPGADTEPVQLGVAPGSSQLAPSGRFSAARTNMGRFVGTGSKEYMRRGLGHYIKTGYGGVGRATSRMNRAANTAGMLYGTLTSFSSGQTSTYGTDLSPVSLAGLSTEEVINAVINSIVPSDGTVDAESSRKAVNDSLSELLSQYPDADLLNLNEEQRLFSVERLLANEVFNRAMLDLEEHILGKCNIQDAMNRFSDIQSYIDQVISAEFRTLCAPIDELTAEILKVTASQALQQTFEVFAEVV